MDRPGRVALAVIAATMLLVSCTSDHPPGTGASSSGPARPPGPVADISTELTGGNGVFLASATPDQPVLDAAGYVQQEFVATGTATSYAVDGPQSADGRWTFRPDTTAPYRTRVLVRRPSDSRRFSGTVVVEWLNVSGGLDTGADWTVLHEEITRRGDIWVGVSAQMIGVVGGPTLVSAPGAEAGGAGKGLRGIDPARYATLDHPGDGYSFDIYTQVARTVRAGGKFLGAPAPGRVIAIGESQSAFALVTYINGVQPLTHAFDAFFVHSRASGSLPLAAPGKPADLVASFGTSTTTLRTDTDVPIMDVQTETDIAGPLNSQAVRQPDSDRFRLWEVAGTAHADRRLTGDVADSFGCGPINDGPMHLVAKAALHALEVWATDGTLPPIAPRLDLTSDSPAKVARNPDGIATAGIRTPPVDVPVDVLSGEPRPGPILCLLSGSTTPLPPERLAQLYSSRADYERKFGASADDAIAKGFVLADDRAALLAFADPSRLPG